MRHRLDHGVDLAVAKRPLELAGGQVGGAGKVFLAQVQRAQQRRGDREHARTGVAQVEVLAGDLTQFGDAGLPVHHHRDRRVVQQRDNAQRPAKRLLAVGIKRRDQVFLRHAKLYRAVGHRIQVEDRAGGAHRHTAHQRGPTVFIDGFANSLADRTESAADRPGAHHQKLVAKLGLRRGQRRANGQPQRAQQAGTASTDFGADIRTLEHGGLS